MWLGMYIGAKAILDVFGMRNCIHRLIDAGFDVKVIYSDHIMVTDISS
jgi:hypothetical protein